jgi:predicted ATPase
MTHGWIIPFAPNRNDKNVEYCFVTNSMRELAYSMILNNQRDSCHLNIGRKLWRKFNQSSTSCLLPQQKSLVLTQLLLGTSAMSSPNERAATAALCLSVAEEEVKWSTFSTAATLLEKGIKLLGDWSWREDYDLTLALHNTSAEVNYVLGDFDTVQKRCQAIFHNARLVDHTLPACSVQISILSAAGNTDEALDVGVDVLGKIGEPIIDRPSTFYIARTLVRLCRLLRRVSPDTIRRLPLMTDSRKAAAMQILNHMIMSAHIGRESLVPILVSKLIELSIRYGLCNVSSVAFGWYGLILASQRKLDLAHQYGKLALELLDRFDSKQWLPRVHLCVYGGVFGCSQNIRDAIAPLSRGFDVGIETGDIEVSHVG